SERSSKLRLAQTEKEIRLILAQVEAFSQNCVIGVMFNDCVMPRCNVVATQGRCFAPKIAELELFVAHHTWIRRPAGLVFAGEIINDQSFELVGFIDDVMRNTE